MRVNVDSSVFTDARFKLLARQLGITVHDAIGKCVHVWMTANEQKKGILRDIEIDALVDRDGFAAALVDCQLARPVPKRAGITEIAGWKKRSNWLKGSEDSGRSGGLKSGETRRRNAVGKSKGTLHAESKGTLHAESKGTLHVIEGPPEGSTNLLSPDLSPSPDLVLSPDLSPDLAKAPDPERARPKRPRPPSGPHQVAVDFFDAEYRRANDGKRPTWDGKNAKTISDLVRIHGSDEVIRRTKVLFSAPPDCIKPPYDVGALRVFFDKLVQPSTSRSAFSVAMSELERLEREERNGTSTQESWL